MYSKDTMEEIFGKVEIATIIKRMKGKKLKQTERNYLSRSIRPKLIAARLLTEWRMLEKIQRPDRSLDKKIVYNLSKYGYEMISLKEIKRQERIPFEELIATIITKAPKPRFIEAIPILLLKNKINKFKLAEIGYKYEICNEVGYLIETAKMLAEELNTRKFENFSVHKKLQTFYSIKKELDDLLRYLENNKKKEMRWLGEEKDSAYKEFLLRTSPKRIKKWNLLGRFFDEDFIKNARAYL